MPGQKPLLISFEETVTKNTTVDGILSVGRYLSVRAHPSINNITIDSSGSSHFITSKEMLPNSLIYSSDETVFETILIIGNYSSNDLGDPVNIPPSLFWSEDNLYVGHMVGPVRDIVPVPAYIIVSDGDRLPFPGQGVILTSSRVSSISSSSNKNNTYIGSSSDILSLQYFAVPRAMYKGSIRSESELDALLLASGVSKSSPSATAVINCPSFPLGSSLSFPSSVSPIPAWYNGIPLSIYCFESFPAKTPLYFPSRAMNLETETMKTMTTVAMASSSTSVMRKSPFLRSNLVPNSLSRVIYSDFDAFSSVSLSSIASGGPIVETMYYFGQYGITGHSQLDVVSSLSSSSVSIVMNTKPLRNLRMNEVRSVSVTSDYVAVTSSGVYLNRPK